VIRAARKAPSRDAVPARSLPPPGRIDGRILRIKAAARTVLAIVFTNENIALMFVGGDDPDLL
jgi:hypothetical protein